VSPESNAARSIVLRAGRAALARIRAGGLCPEDVGVVPAAAGGPKGLILHGLDRFIFGEWLAGAERERHFIGASIGAWRMAAAVQRDPVAALHRLAHAYANQRYPRDPDAAYVSSACRSIVDAVIAANGTEILGHPRHRLSVLAVRGRGPLEAPRSRRAVALGFALAAAANATGRRQLSRFVERVVFHDPRTSAHWLGGRFDAFHTRFAPLRPANLADALLASGSIPLVLEAVADIAQAPPGRYWDGGIVDYHLHLPYAGAGGLVLYPHFTDHIVPGWLDKSFRWRRARDAWLDDVVLVSPSPAFVATLPTRKLPDRGDFKRYGLDHDARIRDWTRAIGESERLADAFARWLERPDPRTVLPLN
jgi:hypothetical protein